MKIHYIKSTGTVSNWPVEENGEKSTAFEISEEDYIKSQTQDWKFELKGEELKVVEDVEGKARRAQEKLTIEQAIIDKKNRKVELISKVSAGTATIEEQTEFADLLN